MTSMTESPTHNDEVRVVEAAPGQLLIGGQWRDASTGGTFEVLDPSTGAALRSVADATPEDGVAALDAAVAAQASFAAMPARKRADLLMDAFSLLHERLDDLALLMTLEMGKPLAEARGEIIYAAEFFRHFAEEAVRIKGNYAPAPAGGSRIIVTRQPVGPCLLITPWNFPMAMGTRKLGPALAAGCTSVIKPAAQTPLSMLALGKILQEVGCPDGVVNIITTHSSGAVMEPLIRSGKARKLSFTGSTQVGRRLMEQCAERVMRTSMELGGNAALIVFDDADLDVAVEGALAAKMRNNGQACTAANRIYVQSGIASAFIDAYSTAMAARTMGRGVEPTTLLGPLVDEPSRAKVQQLVDDAVSRGARVVTGGEVPDGAGFFYPATVLADVPADAEIRTEEIFGPVAPIATFETEAEVIAAANDTEYGLIGYVFTNDLNRALRVSEALETGMVGVNAGVISNPAAPFGGMKESGIGREGGDIGIDEFLEVKYINIPLPPA